MSIGIAPAILLIGPYDPHCGEYTFLAPPLGVWRLAGVLLAAGIRAKVFDPNCCRESPQRALRTRALERRMGRHRLLDDRDDPAVRSRACSPRAARGTAGIDRRRRHGGHFPAGVDVRARAVRSGGSRRRRKAAARARRPAAVGAAALAACAARRSARRGGELVSIPQPALNREELRDAIYSTPYEQMPYADYWERLEAAYRVGALPSKAAREAHLAEIRSVRLITLNYCPMNCTFCSATNFLHEAQGSVASVARLEADECMAMIERIVAAHPARAPSFSRTTSSPSPATVACCRCAMRSSRPSAAAESRAQLQFISTNRIDAMTRGASRGDEARGLSRARVSASRVSRSGCCGNSTRRTSIGSSSRCCPPRSPRESHRSST